MAMRHNKQIYIVVFFSPLPAPRFNYEDNSCRIDLALLLAPMWVISVSECVSEAGAAFQLTPLSRSFQRRCLEEWSHRRTRSAEVSGEGSVGESRPAGEVVEWWCAKGRMEARMAQGVGWRRNNTWAGCYFVLETFHCAEKVKSAVTSAHYLDWKKRNWTPLVFPQ